MSGQLLSDGEYVLECMRINHSDQMIAGLQNPPVALKVRASELGNSDHFCLKFSLLRKCATDILLELSVSSCR